MADEQEIVSDEHVEADAEIAPDKSIGTEPEIEADEGSKEKHEKESDESTVAKGDRVEPGCPVKMGYPAQTCGRKLHVAPEGIDEKPVCLMHSKDRNKQSGRLSDAFWLEFERILEEAGGGEAHFERFVFPQANFSKREFRAICRFEGTTFTRNAHLNEATFTQDAYFSEAKFKQITVFWKATFTRDANFSGAIFTKNAVFWNVIFEQNAELGRAIFKRNANFHEATFKQKASFYNAIFTHDADFREATFTHDAGFCEATFTQNANFELTKFYGTANWQGSRFLDQAAFRRTKFEPLVEGMPSAVFALANFSKPGEIVFDDVDLSRVLFHNCDVSQVCFTSFVRWAKRDGNRSLAVFEERLLVDKQLEKELMRYGPLDFPAVEQVYHQLKRNYDSRLDYLTADEFHFGEMEMKRLAVPTEGRLLCLRRWYHPRLGIAAWYKRASDYGNSYWKPGLLLIVIVLLAASLFPSPAVGLMQQETKQTETYTSVWDVRKSWGSNLRAESGLALDSAIASVDAATFQKSPKYVPSQSHRLGRILAIVETLLTSTLFGLFLLAVRRQFRR